MLSLQDLCMITIKRELSTLCNFNSHLVIHDAEFVQTLGNEIVAFRSHPPLHYLSLCAFGDIGMEVIDFRDMLHCDEFDLNVLLHNGILQNFRSLEHFFTGNLTISNYGLSHLPYAMPNLVEINLSGAKGFDMEGLSCLNRITTLTSVNISDCSIKLTDWPLKSVKQLKSIDLGGNDVYSQCLYGLFESCGEVLTVLGLRGCHSMDTTDNQMLLFRCAATLEELDIRWIESYASFNFSWLQAFEKLKTLHIGVPVQVNQRAEEVFQVSCLSQFSSNIMELSLQSLEVKWNLLLYLLNLQSLRHLCLAGSKFVVSLPPGDYIPKIVGKLPNLRSMDLRQSAFEMHLPVDIEADQQPQRNLWYKSLLRILFPLQLKSLDISHCTSNCEQLVCSLIAPLDQLRAFHAKSVNFANWSLLLDNKFRLRSIDVAGSNIPVEDCLNVLHSNYSKLESIDISELPYSVEELKGLLDHTFPRVSSLSLPTSILESDTFNSCNHEVFPRIFSKHGVKKTKQQIDELRLALQLPDKFQGGSEADEYSAQRSIIDEIVHRHEQVQCAHLQHDNIDLAQEQYEHESREVASPVSIHDILKSRSTCLNAYRPPDLIYVNGLTTSNAIGNDIINRVSLGCSIDVGNWQ